jgi:hypothetical protein
MNGADNPQQHERYDIVEIDGRTIMQETRRKTVALLVAAAIAPLIASGSFAQTTTASTSNLNFGQALEAMKAGKSVARQGWNARNMKIFIERRDGFEPSICMVNAQGRKQPGWLASQPDMLGEDWSVVDY